MPFLRKRTGMVFQDFNLVDRLSAINNVLTGLLDTSNKLMSMFYLFTREQKLLALNCLERVGLLDKLMHEPTNFLVDKNNELVLHAQL